MEEEMRNTGSDAIAEAAKQLYPDQDGIYYGVQIPYVLGGAEPLDGIEIYLSEHGIPHWHYITYGFSELYGEEDDPEEPGVEKELSEETEKEKEGERLSGYGFELTFRLKIGEEKQPPVWPVNLLQNLARYVFQTGNIFAPGHHMNANGPIALEEDTKLTALAFLSDPELPSLNTPDGRVDFIQVVGITGEEMEALMCWNCEKLLKLFEPFLPLYVTDLCRNSFLEQENIRKQWEKGMEADGSSTGYFYTDEVAYEKTKDGYQVRLGAGHTRIIRMMLKARVKKNRPLSLYGNRQSVYFEPGTVSEITEDQGELKLTVSDKTREEFERLLRPSAGKYLFESLPLTLEIVKTEIKDSNGTVVQVIGE